MLKQTHLSLVWLLCLPILAGCLKTTKSEEEEEEHFPPHWPVTVFQASERLKAIASSDASIETKAPSIEREFVDLITWLPELVADSDMTQKEFERIDAWATTLSQQGETLLAKNAKLRDLLEMKVLSSSLSELHTLCEGYAAKMADTEGVQ